MAVTTDDGQFVGNLISFHLADRFLVVALSKVIADVTVSCIEVESTNLGWQGAKRCSLLNFPEML